MKAYVLDYRPLPPEELSKVVVGEKKTRHYKIMLGRKPGWSFGALSDAKEEAAILSGFRASIGNHTCRFDVEEVRRGIFAIVCKDHPGPELVPPGTQPPPFL